MLYCTLYSVKREGKELNDNFRESSVCILLHFASESIDSALHLQHHQSRGPRRRQNKLSETNHTHHHHVQALKMSVTTTDNPISTSLHRAADNTTSSSNNDHLRDYNIHLTGSSEGAAPPTNTDHQPPTNVTNPPGWDESHRGVPPYRPIDTTLDLSLRPWNGNPVGDAFVFTMFTGVFTVAVSFHPACLSSWPPLLGADNIYFPICSDKRKRKKKKKSCPLMIFI